MRPAEEKIAGRPALDELDDAFALLRRCPVGVLTLYYAGALPYVLTFLFFWAEMSTGAYAAGHLVEWSLALAGAFLWGKSGQAVFGAHLLALAAGRRLPSWTLKRLWRVWQAQAALQWSGLVALPLSALITLPFAYTFAFYQNYGILCLNAQQEPQESAALRQEAWREACRWPRQNHYSLAILLLFALLVLANVLLLLFALPHTVRMLLGVESVFSRSNWSMLNTTLFAAACGLAYLFLDPLIRSFYALRCFRGRALSTGEDLLVEIRTLAAQKSRLAAATLILAIAASCLFTVPPLQAQATATPMPLARSSRTVAPDELNRALTAVSQRPEFAWRVPRQAIPEKERGVVQGFFDEVFRFLKKGWDAAKSAVGRFFGWLIKKLGGSRRPKNTEDAAGGGFVAALPTIAWAFAGVAAVILLILIIRARKLQRARIAPAAAAVAAPVPDLTAEDVHADELPEEGWQQLAREMMERGETRLAIRAIYLASLAHLAEREAIALARYKTNRDYQHELRRRRPGQAELQQLFSGLVGTFERAWYGMHAATQEMAEACQAQLRRIQQSQPSLPA